MEAAKQQGAFDFGMEEIRARNLRRVAEAETLFVDPASGAKQCCTNWRAKSMWFDTPSLRRRVRAIKDSIVTNAADGYTPQTKHWDAHRSDVFLTAVKGPRRALEHRELEEKYQRVEPAEARDQQAGFASGQALVGLNLSASDVPNVKQRLGIGTPLGEASPAEIVGLLIGGAVIELDNGWQLTSARIAGDEVVELVLNGVHGNREELRRYGLSEEIINYKRRWFVLSDEAATTLPNLLTQRKPVRDLTAADAMDLVEQN